MSASDLITIGGYVVGFVSVLLTVIRISSRVGGLFQKVKDLDRTVTDLVSNHLDTLTNKLDELREEVVKMQATCEAARGHFAGRLERLEE